MAQQLINMIARMGGADAVAAMAARVGISEALRRFGCRPAAVLLLAADRACGYIGLSGSRRAAAIWRGNGTARTQG